MTGVAIPALTLLLLPFAIAMAVRLMRRDPPAALPPQQGQDSSERLERLEHAIETIAIEVERVSAGQRFLTKLLTERSDAP